VSKGFEGRHLQLDDAPSRKRTNEFIDLILRLGSNHESPGESIASDASRTDLRILPKTLESWDDKFVKPLDRLFPVRRSSGLGRLELDEIKQFMKDNVPPRTTFAKCRQKRHCNGYCHNQNAYQHHGYRISK
jgi:hypothetical protein